MLHCAKSNIKQLKANKTKLYFKPRLLKKLKKRINPGTKPAQILFSEISQLQDFIKGLYLKDLMKRTLLKRLY